MALMLVVSSAFAAYNFLSFTTEIYVDEPLTVEYNLDGKYSGDNDWHPLGTEEGGSLNLWRSAGDSFAMRVKITNNADNPLTVNTVITSDYKGYFTFTGFPNGLEVPKGVTVISVSIDIHGDAPAPYTYDVTFEFTRKSPA